MLTETIYTLVVIKRFESLLYGITVNSLNRNGGESSSILILLK